jgi:hypothetical protein
MKYVMLTQNKVATVSDEDFEEIDKECWYAAKFTNEFRPVRCVTFRLEDGSKKRKTVFLHNVIGQRMFGQVPKGMFVDHIDHDPMNNCRENLRLATKGQNMANSRKIKAKSSRYKGVSFITSKGKWKAEITPNGKRIHLGYFDIESEAGQEYAKAAKKYFGEFACTESLVK